MKPLPERKKISVCECGHKWDDHRIGFFGIGKCFTCICSKFKEEVKMTETEFRLHRHAWKTTSEFGSS